MTQARISAEKRRDPQIAVRFEGDGGTSERRLSLTRRAIVEILMREIVSQDDEACGKKADRRKSAGAALRGERIAK
jgi:hypothetical protein